MKDLYFQFVITETLTMNGVEAIVHKSLIIAGNDEFHIDEYSMDYLAAYKLPQNATDEMFNKRLTDASEIGEITLESHGGTADIQKEVQIFITPDQAKAMFDCGYLVIAK